MSKIISVNVGNSSLKLQLFEIPSEEALTNGIVEKVRFEDVISTIEVSGEKIKKVLPTPDYTETVSILLEALVEYKIVNSLDEITGAGYRAVHSGEIFKESVPITEDAVEKFISLSDLVPLHNLAGLVGYNTFEDNLPNCKHVSVFDTAFHSAMPKEPYIYALPMKYYDEYKIHRYDSHGTGHKYVSLHCVELMNKKVEDTKIVTCHPGNGTNITVVDDGKPINTSMGFIPLADIMVGIRYGDIDSAIIIYIMKRTGVTPDEVNDIMNARSSIFGVSGISSDARDIEDGRKEGNPAAFPAVEVYINRVISVVDDYYTQLGGTNAIVFTGGIDENDTNMRKMICDRLSVVFGIQLDEEPNGKARGKEVLLSTAESKVTV